jgi:sensor c-di-GMP phosphodiesterase-like protein
MRPRILRRRSICARSGRPYQVLYDNLVPSPAGCISTGTPIAAKAGVGYSMANFTKLIISEKYQRFTGLALWSLFFVATLAVIFAFGMMQVRSAMRSDARVELKSVQKLTDSVQAAFEALRSEVTAEPCSAEFRNQLKKVAFRPDGLNEFIYAPDGIPACSTSAEHFSAPRQLTEPDIADAASLGAAVWIDRPLDFVGLKGLEGSIAYSAPFAVVLPTPKIEPRSGWMSKELVLLGPDGRSWHRSGHRGTYDGRGRDVAQNGSPVIADVSMRETVCDDAGTNCVTAGTTPWRLLRHGKQWIATAILFAAVFAAWLGLHAKALLARYWSFEARFLRNLNAKSIVCLYQPLLNVRSSEIIGFEVLARWRDVDGTIVSPDKFIDVVARSGRTMEFTQLVADCAFRELSTRLPLGPRLQVNFNVFPCDLDSAALRHTFRAFIAESARFDLVLEIVESDALPIDIVQREIEALGKAGIKTYIDDFGTGYSNIQNLAMLAVQGVKLDRSFGMAPDKSMMARMLLHAIEMVDDAGRAIVVEGVETCERLELLRKTKRVDFVQGYFVSRPLAIGPLVEFLARDAGEAPSAGLAA